MNSASRTRRDALARHLAARICDDRASEDEVTVLDLVWQRIESGRDLYGRLVVAGDPRNWGAELKAELLDLLAYERIADIERREHYPHAQHEPTGVEVEVAGMAPLELAPFETDDANWGDAE